MPSDTILRLLARPDVHAIAGDAGIDLRRAEHAVATLDDAALTDIAAQARQIEQSLAGGQTITITTTTIIILLLLLDLAGRVEAWPGSTGFATTGLTARVRSSVDGGRRERLAPVTSS